MKKEIKEILNKCREILCSLIKRLHKGMMSILKFINMFEIIPTEISARLFIHTNKNYAKTYVERQCLSRTAEIVLKKKNAGVKTDLPHFKTLKSFHSQECMVLAEGHTCSSMNRTKNPAINPHTYVQLILDKGAKIIQRKDRLSANGSKGTRNPQAKTKDLQTSVTPYIKNDSKHIIE